MTTLLTQFGMSPETTYGTIVTPARFFETDGIGDWKLDQKRAISLGLRNGRQFPGADRFVPYRVGGGGKLTMDVPTKGFGIWLKQMTGAATTVGGVLDSNFLQTNAIPAIATSWIGTSFTAQWGKPFHPYPGTVQPFTYKGCKIKAWTLKCDLDGLLVADFDIDFQDEDTTTALASVSYPSAPTVFAFTGAVISLGGTNVPVKNFSVSLDNKLDLNRRFLQGNSLKSEPVAMAFRDGKWSCTAEFSSLVQYNRFRDALASNVVAAVTATFQGSYPHAGATLPSLGISIPAAQFDLVDIKEGGAAPLMQDISGIIADPAAGGSPLTLTYNTTDAAP